MSLLTKNQYWTINQVFWRTLWFLVIMALVYAGIYFANQDNWQEEYFRWMYELSFVFIFIWFLVTIWSHKWIQADTFLGTDLGKPHISKWWFWLLIFIINSICLGIVTLRILVEEFPEYSDILLSNEEVIWSPIEYLSLTTSIFFAPFIEECIFRGVLFQELTKKWGFTAGALTSSFAFSLLHPFSFIDAFVFAIAMCVFFYKTNRLYLVILFHILYNIIAYLVSSVDVTSSTSANYSFLLDSWWVFLLVALGTMTAIIIFINRNWVQGNTREIPYERQIQ